jgi:hypothetical protein
MPTWARAPRSASNGALPGDPISSSGLNRRRFRRFLEGGERGQHHGDPALHVGDAGAVQRFSVKADGGLKRTRAGKHGVIVAGQRDLERRFGPHAHPQGDAVLGLGDRAVGPDHRRQRKRHRHKVARQGRQRRLERLRHARETSQFPAARIDRRPGLGRRDEIGTGLVKPLQQLKHGGGRRRVIGVSLGHARTLPGPSPLSTPGVRTGSGTGSSNENGPGLRRARSDHEDRRLI